MLIHQQYRNTLDILIAKLLLQITQNSMVNSQPKTPPGYAEISELCQSLLPKLQISLTSFYSSPLCQMNPYF